MTRHRIIGFVVNAKDNELSETSEHQAISGNLFAPALGLAGIALLAFAAWALGVTDDHARGLSKCAAIGSDEPRLACYDKLNSPQQPARGALGRLHFD